MRQRTCPLVFGITLLSLLLAVLAVGPLRAAEAVEATPGRASALASPGLWDKAEAVFGWFWEIAATGKPGDVLARIAVIAVALLSAFLTVVQVWQIPSPDTRLTDPTRSADTKSSPPERAGDAPLAQAPSMWLGNKFAQTVVSGLGGLAAVSFLDDYWSETGVNAKAYYLVLFVVFFLVFLMTSALLRGVLEAVRSRVVLATPTVAWPRLPGKEGRWNQISRWARYRARRFWIWLLSLRTSVLTFGDTFFNLIQGKNQLQTEAFSDAITNLHWSIYWAASRVREDVDRAVCAALRRRGVSQEEVEDSGIRVSISLLSADERWVDYVSQERGSLGRPFDRRSVAWVSVYTGKARWCRMGDEWQSFYAENPEGVTLEENRGLTIPEEKGPIKLSSYFQVRDASDYKGFVVLPFPWAHRGKPFHQRRGAIHISFRNPQHMDHLWEGLEVGKMPNYENWQSLLTTRTGPARREGEVDQVDLPVLLRDTNRSERGLPKPPREVEVLARSTPALRGYLERLDADRSQLARGSVLVVEDSEALIREATSLEAEVRRLASHSYELEAEIKGMAQPGTTKLFLRDEGLGAVLNESLAILPELFAFFNDSIFTERIKPRLRL